MRSARAALDITRRALPPKHYRLGFQYSAWAIALIAQRECVEARVATAEAQRINRAAYGETHAETIGALTWLARIDVLIGEGSTATDELRDALRRSIPRVGAAHADTLAIQVSIEEARAGNGAPAEAALSALPSPDSLLLPAEMAINHAGLARKRADASAGKRAMRALEIFDALRTPPARQATGSDPARTSDVATRCHPTFYVDSESPPRGTS